MVSDHDDDGDDDDNGHDHDRGDDDDLLMKTFRNRADGCSSYLIEWK